MRSKSIKLIDKRKVLNKTNEMQYKREIFLISINYLRELT